MINDLNENYYLINEAFSFLQVFGGLAILRNYLPVQSTFKAKITFN